MKNKTKKQLKKENKELKKVDNIKTWISIIGTLIILIVLTYSLVKMVSNKSNTLEPFDETKISEEEIKCVANNSVLYVSKTCKVCKKQKEILDDYIDEFTIIECTKKENLEKCLEIKGVPTWKINNEYYPGLKTLNKLKTLTNCYQEGEENRENIVKRFQNVHYDNLTKFQIDRVENLLEKIESFYFTNQKKIIFTNNISKYSNKSKTGVNFGNGEKIIVKYRYNKKSMKRTIIHEFLHSYITEIDKELEEKIVTDLAKKF